MTRILFVLMAFALFGWQAPAYAQTPAGEAIVWTDLTGVSATGGDLTKTAPSGWTNGGAASMQSLAADGAVEYTAVQTNTWRIVGMSNGNLSAGWDTIGYGVWLRGDGAFSVLEGGANIGEFGTYVSGDVFRVERAGNTVFYQKNGSTFYTSTSVSTGALVADVSLYDTGSQVNNGMIYDLGVGTPDSTPPVIAGVSVTVLGADRARVSWQTDEPSTSQVLYGQAAYTESSTPLDSALVVSHSVTIGGLTPATAYVFRVRSADISGNTATSAADGTFTTMTLAAGGEAVVWTDLVGTTFAGGALTKIAPAGWDNGGAASYQFIPGDGGVQFTPLNTTTWYFVGLSNTNASAGWDTIGYAIWVRGDGALSVFENGSLVGELGTYGAGDVLRVQRTLGTVSYMRNGEVLYTSTVPSTNSLRADVSLYDNGAQITDASIIGSLPDTAPPVISNVVASVFGSGNVNVTWQTDEPSTSQLFYGTATSSDFSSALDPNMTTSHSVTVTGLAVSSSYLFHVESTDTGGHTAASADGTFVTTLDLTAPVVSGVTVSGIGADSVVVSWTTDEASTSQVSYGSVTSNDFSTPLDSTMTTAHQVTVNGLSPITTYLFRVHSTDASGNTGSSTTDGSFTTADLGANVAAVNWIELTGTTVNQGKLVKTAVDGWGNGGAASAQQILSDGGVEFTADNTNTWRFVGLSNVNTSANWNTIGYAIWARGDGTLQVFENGGGKGSFGRYQTGDVLRVQRTGTVITYLKNGVVFYTSKASSTGSLVVDVSLYNQYGEIVNALIYGAGADTVAPVFTDVILRHVGVGSAILEWQTNEPATSQVLYGIASTAEFATVEDTNLSTTHTVVLKGLQPTTTYMFDAVSRDAAFNTGTVTGGTFTTLATVRLGQPVVWTDLVGTSEVLGVLTKTATPGYGNGGAASVQVIPRDGAFEFTADTSATYRMGGLSAGNASANYDTIHYAIWLRGDGSFEVLESGVSKGNFGAYVTGDVMRVERMGNTVVYKKNDTVFYTSATPSTGDLVADVTLYNRGATIYHPLMYGVDYEPVSTDSLDLQANGRSFAAAASYDGRFVAFHTLASNLDPADGNGVYDIYVKDRLTGVTALVSTEDPAAAGNVHPMGSLFPSLSGAGRYVAFESYQDSMVTGDTNGFADIFVKDMVGGNMVRASVTQSGVQANYDSHDASISASGNVVAFSSLANNLVPGDENGRRDVFVKNLTTGVLVRVTQEGGTGVEGDGDSDRPSLNADGTRVAFETSAGNLDLLDGNLIADVLVADLSTGQILRASESSAGVAGDGGSGAPSLNADGTVVAFASVATNLVASDPNGVMDVFVKNLVTGELLRASESASGQGADGPSYNPVISADGRHVAFWSDATNLVAGDTNGQADAFVKDMLTGEVARISVNFNGLEANAASLRSALSGDGRYVVFDSFADNLVSGDVNALLDVFVTLNPVRP